MITGMMEQTPDPTSVWGCYSTPTPPTPPPEPEADRDGLVWMVDVETRKHDRDETLGPYKTRQRAIQAMLDYLNDAWSESHYDLTSTDEFGGSIAQGTHYDEERSVEVFSRELED